MSRRIIHDSDFIQYVMALPKQEQAKYDMYVPQVSTMRILSDAKTTGLGDVPLMNVGGGSDSNSNSWVMPVVIIVVSAMALMTLYAVLSKR